MSIRARRWWTTGFLRLGVALAAVACALVPSIALAQDVVQIAERAMPAVVTLKAFDARGAGVSQGSGFFLPDGRVVTNAHVVAGASRVDVFGRDEELLGSVPYAEALSSAVDIAVLPRLADPPGVLRLATAGTAQGEAVTVIGAPLGLSHSVSTGVVSAIRTAGGVGLIQITAAISPGSSGGPVLNSRGDVIGVAVSRLRDGESLNFAVPAREVRVLAESPPGRLEFPDRAASSRATASRDGRAVGDASPSFMRGSIRIGDQVRGTLRMTDEADIDGPTVVHFYRLAGSRGEGITISLASADFDAYLLVMSSDGGWMEYDDDSGVGTDARLSVTLPLTDEYFVAATSYDRRETGAYTLSITEGGAGVRRGDDEWVEIGTSETGIVEWSPSTIREVGRDSYEVWYKVVYQDLRLHGASRETYDTAVVLEQVDCARRRMGEAAVVLYRDGGVVHSADFDRIEWKAVVPGSIGATIHRRTCER